MTRAIGPGKTVTATGSVTFAGTLAIDGSTGAYVPHGVGIVASGADVTSDGTVTVQGGGPVAYTFQPVGAATLAIYGTLANVGSLVLTGGFYGIQNSASGGGGYVLDAGTLVNNGYVSMESGAHAVGKSIDGRGSRFDVTGVLVNQSTFTVQSSVFGYRPEFISNASATLTSSGFVSNAGLMVLEGGGMSDYQRINGGSGGAFSSDGTFVNAGTFIAAGGAGAAQSGDHGGSGGYVRWSGEVVNDGTMMFEGGTAGVRTLVESNYSDGCGYGSRLYGSPNLVNAGVLIVGAGSATSSSQDMPGLGAIVSFNGEDGGSFTNSGTVIVQGSAADPTPQEQGRRYGGELDLTVGGANTGLINVQSSGFDQIYGGVLSLRGPHYTTFANSGIISLDAQGLQGGAPGALVIYDTLSLEGGSVLQSGVGYAENMVFNSGTIIGFGTVDVAGVANNGMIIADGGLLRVQAATDGAFMVDPGATLSLYGTIATETSLSLSATGVLIANAAAAGLAISSPGGGAMTIAGGGTVSLGTKDTNLTVFLAAPTTLRLSQAGFLTAIGGGGADTIVAEAGDQVLEGGGGGDTLIGYSGDGDTFLGTAAQLNGATIGNFAGSDVIDVTDLMPGADLKLSYTQQTSQGVLTLREGTQSTSITLLGEFTQSQFSVTSDSGSGILVHP